MNDYEQQAGRTVRRDNTAQQAAEAIIDLLPRFDQIPSADEDERMEMQNAITQLIRCALAPERERSRQTLLLARYFVQGYTNDGESATHAKRVLDNALAAIDRGVS